MTFVQLAVNGVALGAAYALVALGFVFIVNATSAVNFAHGDLVMAGGYVAVGLGSLATVPMILMLPLVAAIMFVVGIAVALVAYFPLINRPPATVFISTLLCGIVLQNLFLVLFGPQARAAPPLMRTGASFRRAPAAGNCTAGTEPVWVSHRLLGLDQLSAHRPAGRTPRPRLAGHQRWSIRPRR